MTTQLTAPAGISTPGPAPTGFSGTPTPVFYVTIKFSSALSLSTSPTLAYTVQSLTTGNNFFSAFADLGPSTVSSGGYNSLGTISGSTLTFPGNGGGSSFPAGETITIYLAYF